MLEECGNEYDPIQRLRASPPKQLIYFSTQRLSILFHTVQCLILQVVLHSFVASPGVLLSGDLLDICLSLSKYGIQNKGEVDIALTHCCFGPSSDSSCDEQSRQIQSLYVYYF